MNNFIIKILKKIFSFLTIFIKPSKIIVFSSYPAFTDNAYAVYRYIIQRDLFKGYKLVWIVLDPNDAKKENIPNDIVNDNLIIFHYGYSLTLIK